jgi:galactoside O-acetyltransferase
MGLRTELRIWLAAFCMAVPGRLGASLRAAWLRRRGAQIGEAAHIDVGVVVTAPENIRIGNRFTMLRSGAIYAHGGRVCIGDGVAINSNVQVGAADGGEIIIGDDVLIGPNVVLRASDHEFDDAAHPIGGQGHTGGRIAIEQDVWIGANVVVVRDVRIGAHSVVAAGAVVTRDVDPYSVVAGVPARTIRQRIVNAAV